MLTILQIQTQSLVCKKTKVTFLKQHQNIFQILRGITAVGDLELIVKVISQIALPTKTIVHKRGLKATEIDAVGVFLSDPR